MGDSITDGWKLSQYREQAGKPYVNQGIGGQTTPQVLAPVAAAAIEKALGK